MLALVLVLVLVPVLVLVLVLVLELVLALDDQVRVLLQGHVLVCASNDPYAMGMMGLLHPDVPLLLRWRRRSHTFHLVVTRCCHTCSGTHPTTIAFWSPESVTLCSFNLLGSNVDTVDTCACPPNAP